MAVKGAKRCQKMEGPAVPRDEQKQKKILWYIYKQLGDNCFRKWKRNNISKNNKNKSRTNKRKQIILNNNKTQGMLVTYNSVIRMMILNQFTKLKLHIAFFK